ncbi:anthocyanidin 3-O-glucosyltransferase 2-like [Phragmites australis]|uniref:anthocyanidin 3-O-glucosyltransferase 2-like n=1 Tax=Phragmites australis TaxID=29695 RepID=UPI002D77C9C2|nr:anthocyanidin 3-O-glucosyltransferase 2-like [Phragmites australis]
MASASPSPTVVLIPICVPGHLPSMLGAGKRLVGSSNRPMSLTVLVMQMTMAANLMSEVADLIHREADFGFDIRFLHLPAVELPTDSHGIEDFMMRFVQLHAPHVKAAVSRLASPVAAVVMDYFCTTLFDVTRELALPVYVYFTSGASMLALVLRLPALDEEVAVDFEEMERAVEVPGLPPVPAGLMPTPLMKKDPNYASFVYHGNRFMEAAGIIVNTVAELEPAVLAAIAENRCVPGRRAPNVYPVGPVVSFKPPSEKPHECVRWLDARPTASVVLLCFGSMGGSFAAPQVQEIADGLERSGHRFLWVLRGPQQAGSPYPTDANANELLPEGFLERTKDRGLVWPRWAPQKDILAHAAVGGFVTHCGWNSTLESLWHGVPLAPWPLFAEQHLNAFELVSVMGVAVAMDVDRKRDNFVKAAELERAVRSLMGASEEGRKARQKAAEAQAVCRNAVEEGGSSYASLQKLAREVSQHAGM